MIDPKTPDLLISTNEKEPISTSFSEKVLKIDGEPAQYDLVQLSKNRFNLFFENKVHEILVLDMQKGRYELLINGKPTSVHARDKISQLLESLGMDTLVEEVIDTIEAPMPGSILEINVAAGSEVREGDSLIILEAMKMENVIKSPRAGIVKSLQVSIGDNVEKGNCLLSFE